MKLLPGLIELVAGNPALQKMAPQTAQEILQSNLLQQLRDETPSPPPARARDVPTYPVDRFSVERGGGPGNSTRTGQSP